MYNTSSQLTRVILVSCELVLYYHVGLINTTFCYTIGSMKRTILIWVLLLFLGLGIIIWGTYTVSMPKFFPIFTSPVPRLSSLPPRPTLSFVETKKPLPSGNGLIQSDFYETLSKPATCQISGQIKFVSPTTAEHMNAYLTYTGIDSPARLIKWQVTPSENLNIGPNLAASIKLPDGKEMINVVLPEKPIASDYKLTASMTYGRLVNHNVEVYEVKCTGQTEVLLNF